MKFASVRELSQNTSKLLEMDDVLIVTKRGKPFRAIIKLDEEDLEEFILAKYLDLEGEYRRALKNRGKGKLLSPEEIERLIVSKKK